MKPYYQDSAVTIYHGDCRETLSSLPRAEFVLTDPPYGVGFSYESYHDSQDNWIGVLSLLRLLTELADRSAICMSFRRMWEMPTPKWALGWFKPGSTRINAYGGFSEWEPILLYGRWPRIPNDAIRLPDCLQHKDGGGDHPCPKPLRLFRWIISLSNDGVILDPFMGSGTTLRAAKDLGRKAIGIEIEERYCEIAAKRMAQETLPIMGRAEVTQGDLLP